MNPAEVKATVYQVSARNAAAMARAAAQAGGGTTYEPLPLPGPHATSASTFSPRASIAHGGDANKSHWEWAYVALEKRHAELVAENEMLFARSQSLERELREARATISHAIEREQAALRQLQQHGHQLMEPISRFAEDPRFDRPSPREHPSGTSQQQSPRHEQISTSLQQSPRHGRRAGQAPGQAAAAASPRGGGANAGFNVGRSTGAGASGVISLPEDATATAAAAVDDDPDLVSFEEFRRITAEHDSKSYNPRQLEARFSNLANPDGRVSVQALHLQIFFEALSRKAPKVIDWLRQYDADGSGDISKKEFKKAVTEVGLDNGLVDVGFAFDTLDDDRSGKVSYKELNEKLRPTTVAKNASKIRGAAAAISAGRAFGKGGAGGARKLQPGVSVAAQLQAILKENQGKVIDLFRKFDSDGDGVITRAELRKALKVLGYDVSDGELDALWREFDPSGDGSITLRELTSVLRAGGGRPVAVEKVSKSMAKMHAVAALTGKGWA